MRVLIPTFPEDIHATAVYVALERRGHEAVRWFTADLPTLQDVTLRISSGGGLGWRVEGPDTRFGAAEPFGVVWYRRPGGPVLPSEVHPEDREVAKRECRALQRAVERVVAPDALWVNPLDSRSRADQKPVQLLEAARVGFRVPTTLVSNRPEEIREFLVESPGEVVYKPFVRADWRIGDGGAAICFTRAIRVEDLPDDEVLRWTPGIFQHRIPKAWELRVTVIGRHLIAARLDSQHHRDAREDWRAAGPGLRIEPTTLPPEVERACFRLMERLGLVFGCLDLILTPEGEHVFLEVNEMGQFLWIEETVPEIRLLEPFCELLIQGRPDFHWNFHWTPSGGRIRFGDLVEDALALQRRQAGDHVRRPDETPSRQSAALPAEKA